MAVEDLAAWMMEDDRRSRNPPKRLITIYNPRPDQWVASWNGGRWKRSTKKELLEALKSRFFYFDLQFEFK